VKFSRNRGRHKDEDAPRHAARRRERDEFGVEPAASAPKATTGPYDVADAPEDVARVDLGSLQIPAIEGVDVGVQVDKGGQVMHVVLVYGDSKLELGAFAAPRSESIWDEIRADIRAQLAGDNAHPTELDGEYGVELTARVRTEDGPVDLRFVGVDGPRWMVRGVYQGAAAVDPQAAGPLAECLRGLVVDRGVEAMPVRDPLPLRIPKGDAGVVEAEADSPAAGRSAGASPGGGGRTARKPKSSTRSRRRG
jgi:hypothetical protein